MEERDRKWMYVHNKRNPGRQGNIKAISDKRLNHGKPEKDLTLRIVAVLSGTDQQPQ